MKIKLFIVSIICLLFLQNPFTVKAVTSVNLFQITTEGSQQKDPLIYKDLVAYDSLSDIWEYNLETKENLPLLEKPGQQYLTSFYKDLIVYDDFDETTQHDSVHLYNLKTKEDRLIAGEPGSHNDGVTNGEYVVFISGSACGTLNAYNIKTKVTVQIYPSTCTQLHISGDIVVFPVASPAGTNVGGYNLKTNEVLDISSENNFQESANIFNDKVVWVHYISGALGDYNSIRFKDLKTGEVKTIYESTTTTLQWPAVSNRYVVWSESSAQHVNGIKAADLKTGEVFEVQPQGPHQNSHTMPSIWKNTTAWMSFRTGNGDIYGAQFNR